MSRTLSVLIPARNETWLGRTVADVLEHSSEQTEVIVVLDGAWPEEPLPQHPRIQVVYLPESIGQRAATNLAARLSTARFVMKLDAHASMADGFDRVLLEAADRLGPRTVQIPAQTNLHVYSRICTVCKKSNYQGPMNKPCECGGACTIDIVWKPRRGTTTTCWVLDSEIHFQYGSREMRKRQVWKDDIADVMTSLGACIFIERSYFFELGGFDEAVGSWGQFGQELASKVWTSGGRHVCNRRTSFSHFFRVGGIGFSYPIKGSEQEYARQYSRNLWRGNHWEGQVRPFRWIVDKFWPVDGWTKEQRDALSPGLNARTAGHARIGDDVSGVRGPVRADGAGVAPAGRAVSGAADDRPDLEPVSLLPVHSDAAPSDALIRRTRGVVYYSDCRPDACILEASRQSIEASGMPIVAVTLAPIRWPSARHIVLDAKRGTLTMFRQILAGLEAIDTDDVFFCEHDVLYDRSHFQFTPPDQDRYHYNLHCWKVDAATGRAVHYRAKQTSGLCADRQLLIDHYRKRIALVERDGFSRRMGFEPGSHHRAERVDDVPSAEWWSAHPNIDIRHTANLTPSRWSPDEFRSQRNCQGWTEGDGVPGLGVTKGRFWEWLEERHEVPSLV